MKSILAAVFTVLLIPNVASADSVAAENCLGGLSLPETTESVVCTFPGFKVDVPKGKKEMITMIEQGTKRTPSDKITFWNDPKTGNAMIMFQSDTDGLGFAKGKFVFEPKAAFVPLIPKSGKGRPGFGVIFKSDTNPKPGKPPSDVITVVPEPSTVGLLGTGLLGISTFLRRRRKQASRTYETMT